MLSMPWHELEKISWQDLYSASPLGTLVTSLLIVSCSAVLYVGFQLWRTRSKKRGILFEWFLGFLRAVDQWVVLCGSLWVGTRVRAPGRRHVVMLVTFILVAVGGVLAPWPLCLYVLSFGLLNVFIIFRHWSHDEDEVKNEASPENKKIKIQGDLSIEMLGACAFVLVHSTTGFAKIQAARHGFQIPPDAGPFTFARYAFVEFLKELPLVNYSDLFSDDLDLLKLSNVAPTLYAAKWAVLVFRGAVGLICK